MIRPESFYEPLGIVGTGNCHMSSPCLQHLDKSLSLKWDWIYMVFPVIPITQSAFTLHSDSFAFIQIRKQHGIKCFVQGHIIGGSGGSSIVTVEFSPQLYPLNHSLTKSSVHPLSIHQLWSKNFSKWTIQNQSTNKTNKKMIMPVWKYWPFPDEKTNKQCTLLYNLCTFIRKKS